MCRLKTLMLASLVCCSAFRLQQVLAQDETTEPTPETKSEQPADTPPEADKPDDAPEAADDAQSQWNQLSARKKEIALELADLRKKFATATVEEKRKIRDQFQKLIDEFLLEISPKMTELADEIYQAHPDNTEAGEFVLQSAWREMDYSKVVEVADKLIAAGHLTGTVLNYGGAAHFAENDFGKAVELLTQAKTRNSLDPNVGGRFLEPAKEYVELWNKEQAIREKEANAPEGEQNPRVELQTSKGKILLELFENEAPNTVANFISLTESGFYDGVKFHRVIPNFMAQAGDPRTKEDTSGDSTQGGPGYTIKCECQRDDARMHFAGSLAMGLNGDPITHASVPDTGGSQFYITHLPTPHLNSHSGNSSEHTVFGRVVEGLDVVRSIEQEDVIEKATVVRKRDHEYQPETTSKQEKKEKESVAE